MNVFTVGRKLRIVNGPFAQLDDPTGTIKAIHHNCTYGIEVEVNGAHGPKRIYFMVKELELIPETTALA